MKRFFLPIILFLVLFFPNISLATSISVSPASGVFTVGSTFDVSILLDTEGKSINALQVYLSFPPDKLQVVSPAVGQSIVGVWTVPPRFNNTAGTIELEGGIPGGITASSGVLTKITFRVKSVGEAIVKLSDRSRVFLDNGLATDDLSHLGNAVFQLRLPPPAGPIVVSDSHPDQNTWYPNSTAVLRFANNNPAEGYSYVLNKNPVDIPDNISEGARNSVVYNNVSDGVHYFHIKSLRDGIWGGTTNFVVKVDTTPPADFPLNILPGARTSSTKPVVEFETTDADSGIDHYEIKIEPLSLPAVQSIGEGNTPFFIETLNPYIPPQLQLGSYNVVVRVFDRAMNYREVTERLVITSPFFKFIDDRGIQVGNLFLIPWLWFWIIAALILSALGYGAYRTWLWRHEIARAHMGKLLPADVLKQLEELKAYREKYGKGAGVAAVLFIMLSLFSFGLKEVHAQYEGITPPIITSISEDISNKEIFYVGGETNRTYETVVIYFQNMTTGETQSATVESDEKGDWFYRHDTFLSPGDYTFWAQTMRDQEVSPPSSPSNMTVRQTAVEFGANRLSYEAIYLFLVIVLLLGVIGLTSFIIYHSYHGRKRHKEFIREVKETEESIRRGFAVLRRDIEAELAVVRKSTMSDSLSQEEKEKEAQLLYDLNVIQKRIGKEVWELEKSSW